MLFFIDMQAVEKLYCQNDPISNEILGRFYIYCISIAFCSCTSVLAFFYHSNIACNKDFEPILFEKHVFY